MTAGPRTSSVLALSAFLVAGLAACSSGGSPSPAVSGAASSLASQGRSEASSAVSSAASSLRSGLDASGDVTSGPVTIGADGKAATQLTVTNHGSSTYDYVVTVTFRDASGNTLDAAVVTVSGVGAGQTKTATARSNRDLTGTVTARVEAALRH